MTSKVVDVCVVICGAAMLIMMYKLSERIRRIESALHDRGMVAGTRAVADADERERPHLSIVEKR